MADFIETIKLLIDTDTSKATTGLSGFKSKLGEAEGAVGKLKAGAGGVFDAISTAGPVALAGVGAAIGGFVLKGVSDFQNLALSAQNFATVAGTSVTDASRWVEVSTDLGVQSDLVAGAMSRLNREADQGKLAKFGITAENANDRLIQTVQYIQSIPDEAARAQAAFEIFGKSGAALAPIIASAGELKDRFNDVSGAKLISDENVADAREFRDTMDRVTDAVDNLALSAGKFALPFLQSLAEIAGPLAEFIGKVGEARAKIEKKSEEGGGFFDDLIANVVSTGPEFVQQVGDAIGGAFDTVTAGAFESADAVNGATSQMAAAMKIQEGSHQDLKVAAEEDAAAIKEQAKASKEAEDAIIKLGKALADQADALKSSADSQYAANKASRDAAQAFDDLDGKIKDIKNSKDDDETKTRNIQQAYEDAAKAAGDMADAQVTLQRDTDKAKGATQTHTEALDTWNASILTSAANAEGPLKQAIVDHIAAVNGIPPEKVTEILASTPNLEEQKKLIDAASAARKLTITADADTSQATAAVLAFMKNVEAHPAYIDVIGRLSTQGQAHARGGGIFTDQLALVGEEGPELVVLPGGSYVMTAHETKGLKMYADGGTVTSSVMTGSSLHDLFMGGKFVAADDNDPLGTLFGSGGEFANWMIPSGPYRGMTLGALFGPGGQFYTAGGGTDALGNDITGKDVLEQFFGTGSDFATYTANDPKVRQEFTPTQTEQMKKLAAEKPAVPTLMPFGWFSDAAGLHGPSGSWAPPPTTTMPAMPPPPPSGLDAWGLPMTAEVGNTPYGAYTGLPKGTGGPPTFGARAVGGGGRQQITINITGGIWMGSKAEIGRQLVEAIKAYERISSPVLAA